MVNPTFLELCNHEEQIWIDVSGGCIISWYSIGGVFFGGMGILNQGLEAFSKKDFYTSGGKEANLKAVPLVFRVWWWLRATPRTVTAMRYGWTCTEDAFHHAQTWERNDQKSRAGLYVLYCTCPILPIPSHTIAKYIMIFIKDHKK